MFGLIPFICIVLSCMAGARRADSCIEGIIKGGVVWALAFLIYLTMCSSVYLITFNSVLLFWAVYAVLCCVLLHIQGGIFPQKESIRSLWRMFSPGIWLSLAILFGATLMTAILYPPNNWDAMTYNMPRVMQWIQNMTLAPYITSIDRQIGMAPLQSILILPSLLLGETDVFAPLVQWFCYIGTCLAVVRICAQLGGSKRMSGMFFDFFKRGKLVS